MIRWLNKIDLLVLLTVTMVLVFMMVMLYGFNKNKFNFLKKNHQPQLQTQTVTKEPKFVRTDYTDVARKTLDWIDKQRNEDGWYILERGCDYEKRTCDIVWDCKEGNKDGLIATWARLNFYEQHKDPKDLEIVKKDIDIFYEKYKNKDLSDSLWICKITYEIAHSKHLDQEQKDKLKELCLGVQMPGLLTGEVEYNQRLLKKSSNAEKENPILWKSWVGYTSIRGFDNYFGLASDLVTQYLWTSDESRLNLARKYFESAKKIIEETGLLIKSEDDCLVGLAAIDLYEFGGEEARYLRYVKEKYVALFDIKGNVKKYRTTICGLLSKKLYQITKEELFIGDMEKNNRTIIGLWDNSVSLNKISGNNGFYMASVGGGIFPIKNITENGLMVESIRN